MKKTIKYIEKALISSAGFVLFMSLLFVGFYYIWGLVL